MCFLLCVPKPKGQLVRYINGRYVDLPHQKRHPQNHLNWCKICIKFIPFNRVITVSDFTKWLVLLKNVECWSIILNNIEQGVKEGIIINFIFSFIETVSWKSTVFFFLRMDARPRREITWPSKEGAYYLRATKSITRWPFLPLQPVSWPSKSIKMHGKTQIIKMKSAPRKICRHMQFYLDTIHKNASCNNSNFFLLIFVSKCYSLWELLYGCI